MRTLDQVIAGLPAARRAKVLARGRQLVAEDHVPNAKTTTAIAELEAGGGRIYAGKGAEIIAAMLREEE